MRPVSMQFLFCDLTKVSLEHGKEALAPVNGETYCCVRDQVEMSVTILGEQETNGESTRVGILVGIRYVFEPRVTTKACEEVGRG